MSTFSLVHGGHYLSLEDPEIENIQIRGIAHALGMICRFNGHVDEFYSVAEHSVHVSNVLRLRGFNIHTQLCGLLHDAQEAYVGDLVQPMKNMSPLGKHYKIIEDRFEAVIAEKFKLQWNDEIRKEVRQADLDMCALEMKTLMSENPIPVNIAVPPDNITINNSSPRESTTLFMRVYRDLTEV